MTEQEACRPSQPSVENKHLTNSRKRAARRGTVLVILLMVGGTALAGFIRYWNTNAEGVTQQLNRSRADAHSSQTDPVTDPSAPTQSADDHPLDPALKIARQALERIENEVVDYTARIIKRERTGGKLGDEQQMFAKIRNRKFTDDELKTSLAVYLKFLEPRAVRGREVIWVEDQNEGRLIAHDTGLLNLVRPPPLNPDGPIAMFGQRYPIYKIGIQNLVEELIVKGERDRKIGETEVNFIEDQEVAGRLSLLLEVKHDEQLPEFDFHVARIWIDNELQLPIRYAAWGWPEKPGGEPLLLEDYTYADLKINVGLQAIDFDPDNPEYDYP